jgi:CRISPR/Cas system CMR subunit Cmr4 (Cas7 group RAMP superfamily)
MVPCVSRKNYTFWIITLNYHLNYQKYIEEKIVENTAEIKSYMLENDKEVLDLAGYKVTLAKNGNLTLDRLPESNLKTISLFEWLKEKQAG